MSLSWMDQSEKEVLLGAWQLLKLASLSCSTPLAKFDLQRILAFVLQTVIVLISLEIPLILFFWFGADNMEDKH